MLAPARHPPREWTDIAKQVEQVLAERELADVLRVLEKHNKNRATPFLLGPHLFHVVRAVTARKTTLAKMPILGGRPQEVRSHYQDAAYKAKALARLLRKGPQPLVAVGTPEATIPFQPCRMIGRTDLGNAIVPLDQLLDDAAASLLEVRISGTRWHRKTAKEQLRYYTSRFLATKFRQQLNHPYHSHVATIVMVLTGIDTDEDYVKKIDKRRPGAAAVKGHNS